MASKKDEAISVLEVNTTTIALCILGTTPIILNRMSEKAKGQLLLPPQKKNAAEKASTLKHEPLKEFRASAYQSPDEKSPTLLRHLSTAFKNSLRNAALDIPGANKSQVGRLTYVNGDYIDIFGVPKLLMSVTRSADINRTPDVRTRVIVPEWACMVMVTFVTPLLREQAVVNLFAAAGIMQGVGDWRPGKGSGTYGSFKIVSPDDSAYKAVVKNGGRAAQIKAMDEPEAYDVETEELLAWFDVEVKRRGFKVA